MPEAVFRKVAGPGLLAVVVECAHYKQNIRWIIWQMSVESSQEYGVEVEAVRRNGRYITSSFIVPAAAQGPPAFILDGGDIITFSFAGLDEGEEAIVNLFYEEVLSGEVGSAFGLV